MKQNRIYLASLFTCVFIVSCSSSINEESLETEPSETDTTEVLEDTLSNIEIIDSFQLRLDSVMSGWFDLSLMKKEIGFLEMGTSISSKYLIPIDSTYESYNYGAVGGLVMKRDIPMDLGFAKIRELNQRFISISTYKPWSTAQEKYYSNNNEIIVGFETMVEYETLGNYNLVNKTRETIVKEFGPATVEKSNCSVYFSSGKALVLHYKQDKIDWLKSYHLNDSSFASQALPENIFQWTMK